jgi:RDD family
LPTSIGAVAEETMTQPIDPAGPPTGDQPSVPPSVPPSAPPSPLISAAPTPPVAWVAAPAARPEIAPGLAVSDTGSRFVAYVVDSIGLGIVSSVIAGALGWQTVASTEGQSVYTGMTTSAAATVLSVGLSAIYFIASWSGGRRATLGQRLFQIQVGNAFDGRSLALDQAIKRWLGLGAFLALLGLIPSLAPAGLLAQTVWTLALLVTTVTSPNKQGLHDRFANSVLVRPTTAGTGLATACLVIVIVLAALAILSIVALIFLGGQVSSILSAVGESV